MKRSFIAKLFLFLGILSCALLFTTNLSATSSTSTWFDTADPEFNVESTNVSESEYPTTITQHGNIDCSILTFTHREGELINHLPGLYKETKTSGCYVNTSVGAIDSNGYVNVGGTDYIGDMTDAAGNLASFRTFPNTDVFISNSSASPANGALIWFDHLQSSLSFLKSLEGKIFARIKPLNQTQLTDKSGTALPVMADNFGISENGDWLVVDSPGRALLRVNLRTMEVLPFENSFEYGNGIGAALRYAVSGDGRYVAVASKTYSYFRIFDISTCGSIPNIISAPLNCQSRDLNTLTRTRITDMGGVLQMRFLTDNLLRFYATYDISNSPKTGQYVIAAPGTSLAGMDYLALGDSFSSGEGAQKYEIGTDEKENLCHLSRVSFPYIISQKLSLNSFHSVACSGANTLNLNGGTGLSKDASNKNRDNQYNDRPLKNSLGDWIPGYVKQLEFVTENSPHLITVTASGNDIGFAEKLKSCVKPGTCFPNYEDKKEVFNEVDSKLNIITDMYVKIRKEAPKDTKIYAIGYPQVALPGGSCGVNVHFNKDELTFAGKIITRLNSVIKTAAAKAGVNYVDINDALNSYRLCEGNAGNIAMNGLTAGKDKFGLIGNESYHPNEFGQFLMAQKILGLTNNLGTLNPAAVPIVALQPLNEDDSVFTGSTKVNRPLNKLLSFTPTSPITYFGQNISASLSGISYALPLASTFQIKLDDTLAGIVTTDGSGNINFALPISPAVEPGIHTVHIYGEDATSQPIDISAVITIGSSQTDFNGNGIPDSVEQCAPLTPSNKDDDKDGIDDACDPIIGPAPIEPIEPTDPTIQFSNVTLGISNPTSSNGDGSTTPANEGVANIDLGTSQKQPENFAQAVGMVLGSANIINKEGLNPAPVIKSAKDILKEKASLHPKQFMALILILIFIFLFILMLHERELEQPKPYTAYA